MNLRAAYQKFYSGLAKLPKFHSRKSKNSYKNSMMKQNCLNWNEHQRDENAAVNIITEAIRVLREPEESEEKSSNCLSKDAHCVLSTNELANLALSIGSGIGNARNNPTHAKVL